MNDPSKIHPELIDEISALKQRIKELEQSESERKQAEEILCQQYSFSHTIIDGMAEGLYVYHNTTEYPFTTFTIWNDRMVEITGYTMEEINRIGWYQTVYPDPASQARAMERMKRLRKGKNIRAEEWEITRADGNNRILSISPSIVESNDGIVHVMALVQDVTERRKSEEALREQGNKMSSIFRAAPVGIGMVVNRVLLEVNDMLCSMTGYSSEELLGQNARMLYPTQEDFDYVGKEKYRQIGQNNIGTVETRWKKKDGTVIHIILSSTPLDFGNLAKGVTFTALDITARKQAEEALREVQNMLQIAVAQSPSGILIADAPDVRIRMANPAAFAIRGGSTEILTDIAVEEHSRKWQTFYPDGTPVPSEELPLSKAVLKGKVSRNEEVIIRHESGDERWVMANAAPILDSKGNIRAGIVLFHDITDLKRAEEEKRRIEEHLQHANKMEAIGTLAGGIAHDFNNLLMGIQGYASLSLMNTGPSHPNYERLKRIEEQVQSGADLTRQLLGFARGGRYEIKPADMNDIIKETASMFGRTKKEITIHRKFEKDLFVVEVDRGQLERVFMNLYVNAWQAMPGGGEIYLETENVLLDDGQALSYGVKPGNYIKISMTDTGTGMDEKTRERIFDPFFTTKDMGRGTGLGLATVYGIIKGHNGMINVYSEAGHGTTFTIYLPASEREVVKEKATAGTIVRGTETILLVDDEQMILEVSKALLESIGYRVYAVGSGQEAIAVYMEKRNEIGLVVLDMIMPGMSGGEALDRLREINPDIKVILSSGYSINGEARGIMDKGCNGFLQKPFQFEELSSKVREVLG
jgi:two-component system, cell cycle sensor histidine kinase and response regulator CckA